MMSQKLCAFARCNRLALGVCLAATLAVLGSDTRAAAQGGNQGKYITQASANLIGLVGKANDDGFVLAANQLSIGGGWVKQGADSWVTLYSVQLEGGRLYRVLAAGDNDARDVDVEVTNPKGNIVARDDSTDPKATVNYRPPVSGRYTVRVRLFAARGDDPCVVLGIVMIKR
jgi:hypothetical protein